MITNNINSIRKKIELWLKSIIESLLKSNKNLTIALDKNNAESIFNSGNCRKILLIRHDRIGDLLVSVPFIRNLGKILPDSEIDILLSSKNIGASPAITKYVNKIWFYNKKIFPTLSLIKKLRQTKYNLVIDLFDNASVSAGLFVKFAKASFSLGLDKENRNIYDYTVPLKNKMEYHIVERLAELLVPFGADISNLSLSLEYNFTEKEIADANNIIGSKNKPVRLGINLAGSGKAKDWGSDNHILFINRVISTCPDVEVFIFGMREMASSINKICLQTKAKIAPASDSFHEFAALLNTCDIILTPDTSGVHLASAWQKPCIAMYSFIDERFGMPWIPYNSPSEVIITKEPTLMSINVDEVFNAFMNIKNKI